MKRARNCRPGAAEGPSPSNAGDQLGPYRIEGVVGEGGMGVVYRALDTKLNRPVAIKFLSDDLADAARAGAFSARRRWRRRSTIRTF